MQISNLHPESLYRFVLRAWNQHGASAPSDMTEAILTRARDLQPITQYELLSARKFLDSDVLSLKQLMPVSSTTLKVIWDVSVLII